MSKRNIAWLTLTVVGLLAAAGMVWAMIGTHRISFTEADLQQQLNHQLPKTVHGITIEHVNVQIADRRLALRISLQANVLRQSATATVTALGVPRYVSSLGEIFFDADDLKLVQLTVAGKAMASEDGDRRGVAGAAWATVQRLSEAGIKSYLAARAVYRFHDDIKGAVLRSALVDLTVEPGAVVVTVSIWNLTITVALYALVIILVLWFVYYLIRHPLWGLGTVADIITSLPGEL